jgi:hypothetical protein
VTHEERKSHTSSQVTILTFAINTIDSLQAPSYQSLPVRRRLDMRTLPSQDASMCVSSLRSYAAVRTCVNDASLGARPRSCSNYQLYRHAHNHSLSSHLVILYSTIVSSAGLCATKSGVCNGSACAPRGIEAEHEYRDAVNDSQIELNGVRHPLHPPTFPMYPTCMLGLTSQMRAPRHSVSSPPQSDL